MSKGKLNKKYFLPEGAYDTYTLGLQRLMETGISLDEAMKTVLKDFGQTGCQEKHIHLVNAAYKKLKEGE